MQVNPCLEYYYLDVKDLTTDTLLEEGMHGFYLDSSGLGSEFFNYWDQKGVNANSPIGTWQSIMWQIIKKDAIENKFPMYYLKVSGATDPDEK